MRAIQDRALSPAEVTSLFVTVCAPVLPSPAVVTPFLWTVVTICFSGFTHAEANRVACGTAGVIPVVVGAMCVHGPVDAEVGGKGCWALARLAERNVINADAIVLFAGGLGVILSVITAHPRDAPALGNACFALY